MALPLALFSAGDFDGYLPPQMLSTGGVYWSGPFWVDLLEETLRDDQPGQGPSYERNPAFYCPREEKSHSIGDYGNNPNILVSLSNQPPWTPINLKWSELLLQTQIDEPDKKITLVDSKSASGSIGEWHISTTYLSAGAGSNSVGPHTPRHGNLMFALHADGHVSPYTIGQLHDNRSALFEIP